jgi:hypothetical protein
MRPVPVQNLYWASANVVHVPDKQYKTGREKAWPEQVDAFAWAESYHGPSLLGDRPVNGWVAVLLVLLHVLWVWFASFTLVPKVFAL